MAFGHYRQEQLKSDSVCRPALVSWTMPNLVACITAAVFSLPHDFSHTTRVKYTNYVNPQRASAHSSRVLTNQKVCRSSLQQLIRVDRLTSDASALRISHH